MRKLEYEVCHWCAELGNLGTEFCCITVVADGLFIAELFLKNDGDMCMSY